MSRARAKGTRFESAIVDYLRNAGDLPHVERRARSGAKDRGDIAGIPGVVIEAKACREMELAKWVDEAEVERVNDGAAIGVVWHHRRGKGSPGDGYVTMSGWQFISLLMDAGYVPKATAPEVAGDG